MKREILGVKIDDISFDEATAIVRGWLVDKGEKRSPRVIVTPGPEFLLTATRNEEFRNILNEADLALPDGFGLQLFAGVKNRVPGRIFMLKLCQEASKNHWSIGLIGGWSGEGEKAKEFLEKRFPGITISLIIDGDEATRIKSGSVIDRYIMKSIDILFVGLGHPEQEMVLDKIKKQNLKVKAAMGVGSALDYLAGKYPEPPGLVQAMGVEWFWRLLTQTGRGRPRHWQRIFSAVFVFPWVLLSKKNYLK